MNIYLIYFMIFIIFIIISHSYYLPKNNYCHLNTLNNKNNENDNKINSKGESQNKDKSQSKDESNTKKNTKLNNTDVLEGFDGHTEEDRRYIKVSDLIEMKNDTNKLINKINKNSNKIKKFKNDTVFYQPNSNINSYKRIKKFIEDEKYNPRYHESLREYDRNYKIEKINKDLSDIISKKSDNIELAQKGTLKNIKSYNANHYIRVKQPHEINGNKLINDNKINNINNPFTVFVNKGCLSFNNEDNSFKVSDMCNLTDSKQQFKLNKISETNKYNKIVEDSGNKFLYSLPKDNNNIKLDQPFYVIHPIDNSGDNSGENLNKNQTKCLTQLGEHLSVEPCNLHTNQRWLFDFKDRQ